MIKLINYGTAVSDEGFKVKLDKDYASYTEPNFAIRISISVLSLKLHTELYDFGKIEKFLPDRNNYLTFKEKEIIIPRVEACLKLLLNKGGYVYEITRTGNTIITKLIHVDKKKRIEEGRRTVNEIKSKFPK